MEANKEENKHGEKSIYYYDSLIGCIGIADNGEAVTEVSFNDRHLSKDMKEQETPLIKRTIEEIRGYLAGERKDFDIPLALEGTEFQKSVWRALQTIPYGETRSYKDIAVQIGNAKACRAVGMANNRNPISIIVPCHRVIGADGKLVGYGGGVDIKKFLLQLEGEK